MKEKQPHEVISSEEYLDLVDTNDNVIGRKSRSAVLKEGLTNFRIVNLFLVNAKGQLWIPKRDPNKKIYPDSLDFSMGGFVSSGESYEDALKRETREELNLDLETINYKLLGKLSPERDSVASFMQIYEVPMEETPDYNPDDFTESSWIFPHELQTIITNGAPAKSDLIIVLNHFYIAHLHDKSISTK